MNTEFARPMTLQESLEESNDRTYVPEYRPDLTKIVKYSEGACSYPPVTKPYRDTRTFTPGEKVCVRYKYYPDVLPPNYHTLPNRGLITETLLGTYIRPIVYKPWYRLAGTPWGHYVSLDGNVETSVGYDKVGKIKISPTAAKFVTNQKGMPENIGYVLSQYGGKVSRKKTIRRKRKVKKATKRRSR